MIGCIRPEIHKTGIQCAQLAILQTFVKTMILKLIVTKQVTASDSKEIMDNYIPQIPDTDFYHTEGQANDEYYI